MSYLLLITVIFSLSIQNVFQKQYNTKVSNASGVLFSGMSSFTAFLFFVIQGSFTGMKFNAGIIPYALLFAAAYFSAVFGLLNALKYGSLAITTLIYSYSLIIPTFYGLFFLDEKLRLPSYIGLGLLAISLYFVNYTNDKSRFSIKWLICLLPAFFGNGLCTTFQKMQQLKFNGQYKSEFMIVSLLTVSLFFFIVFMITGKSELHEIKPCIIYSIPNGFFNALTNILVMVLTGAFPNAILFPSISSGGIVLSFIFAIFIYNERLNKRQIFGYVCGIISVILLNLS